MLPHGASHDLDRAWRVEHPDWASFPRMTGYEATVLPAEADSEGSIAERASRACSANTTTSRAALAFDADERLQADDDA
jgi:hypothetical protein